MHLALVVNPTSGTKRGAGIAQRVAERLEQTGHTTVLIQADDAESVRGELEQTIAGRSDATALDGVVVVGGDGALHAVLDLVAESGLVLGLVPAGTGNDMARSLGIPVKDVDAAVDLVLGGHVRTVDLIRTVGGSYVATVIASGFDSKVNERANAMTWPRGNMRYNIAIVKELRAFEPLAFTITLDGRTIEREAMLVAVGNGPSFGGGLRICEGASMDDGLLDVVIVNPVSTGKFIRVFPKLYRGTHVTLPEFERHRVREVTLSSPGIVAYGDGERLGPLPFTASIRPGALRVFAPPAPA